MTLLHKKTTGTTRCEEHVPRGGGTGGTGISDGPGQPGPRRHCGRRRRLGATAHCGLPPLQVTGREGALRRGDSQGLGHLAETGSHSQHPFPAANVVGTTVAGPNSRSGRTLAVLPPVMSRHLPKYRRLPLDSIVQLRSALLSQLTLPFAPSSNEPPLRRHIAVSSPARYAVGWLNR